ncbi:MAG: response regulator [Ferrovibrio sp.]|uniref:response regulator transcription factor n=1 Tax=Ferrovibrio sp. TaxID=1917215 RepID=UPI00261187F6|nr:response regulator [Ferrovibrio sp.]MCW0236455.1 response regulator [Ferrovibrio sp.]
MIYVVDDDDVVRDSLRALLEVSNYQVSDFESGDHFLSELDLADGCVILDVHMPGLPGTEVLRRLRERGVTIPVILITGRRDSQIEAQASAFGALALIDKPLSHTQLFGAIEQALRRS